MIRRSTACHARAASAWPLCLCVVLSLSACTPPVGPVGPPGPAVVYIVDRGWHTDVTLPVDEISGPLAMLEASFPGVRFLSFGFGERQFFMARHTTLGETLSALLPSQSALLMTALSATPEAAFGTRNVVALHISSTGSAAIQAAIWQELARSPQGQPIPLAGGPYPGSVFYAARGTYDAFDTCNTWTADVLHAGGLPVSSKGVVFSGQIMGEVRTIAAEQASLRGGGA
jgi:uncharacterized protein (TIGR02117 family)